MRTDREVEQRHSRAMVHGRTNLLTNPRIVEELREKNKLHGDIAVNELNKEHPNYEVINPNQSLATLYHEAATTIEKLLEQNGRLTEVLKERVLVALSDAKSPAWVPTHRHYKGTLYRVTGIRYDAEHEELVEKVEYDDEDGGKFVLAKRRWESTLDSGKQRYEFLYLGSDDPVKKRPTATLEDIRRAAKERSKRTGMSREAALNEAAISAGFSSFSEAETNLAT